VAERHVTVLADSRGRADARVEEPPRPWRAIAELLAALVPMVGLVLYVLVRSYYNQFYGRLGIDPEDVGLDYATTLQSSLGLLFFVAIAVIAYPTAVIVCLGAIVRVVRDARSGVLSVGGLTRGLVRSQLRTLRWALPLCCVAGLAILSLTLTHKAAHFANAVNAGRPVKFGSLALTSFKVRATPLRIDLVEPAASQPGLAAVARRAALRPPLLYLGRANGVLVLYDSRAGQAIYVPASPVLRLSNCETPTTRRPECRGAIG
jgi:hypothetical protein